MPEVTAGAKAAYRTELIQLAERGQAVSAAHCQKLGASVGKTAAEVNTDFQTISTRFRQDIGNAFLLATADPSVESEAAKLNPSCWTPFPVAP